MVKQGIFLKPVITEKAFDKAKQGWYTFLVERWMNKYQARKLIEEIFNVKVEKIKSVIVKGKSRSSPRSRRVVKLPTYKKISVKLATGQKIDLFETGGGE